MTIDEAIKHCEEEAEKYMEYGIETECYQCGKEYEQLAEWLRELKALRAAAEHETDLVDEYEAELKEAKRLLKLAVEDMSNVANDVKCPLCKKWKTDCCNTANFLDCYVEDRFKWRYADEAEKLLSEEI